MPELYIQYSRHGKVVAALTRLYMGEYASDHIRKYNIGPFSYDIHSLAEGWSEDVWSKCDFLGGQPCYVHGDNFHMQRRIWKTRKKRHLKKIVLGRR